MKSALSGFARRQLLAAFALCVVVSVSAPGQVYVQGQPTVGDPTNLKAATSASFLDATQFSGSPTNAGGTCGMVPPLSSTADGQIQAAICNLPTTGGTVDARGLGSGITFGSNPFADPTDTTGAKVTTKPVILLLPAGTITVNAVIGVPKQSLLRGQGSLSTTLLLGPTFPGFTAGVGSNPGSEVINNCGAWAATTGPRCFPVICMGNGLTAPLINVPTVGNSCETPLQTAGGNTAHLTNNPRVQIESLGIDLGSGSNGDGTIYGVAIENITAQEKSWVKNVQIAQIGSGGRGINVAATGRQTPIWANDAQNSGPYTDLEINWAGMDCSSSTFSTPTYGIFVSNSPSVTVGSGGHITINGHLPTGDDCTPPPTSNLVSIDASGAGVIVENVHTEKWYDGVQLGATADAFGARVANLTVASNVINAVEISNNHTVTGVVSSVESMGTNSILDHQSSGFASTSSSLSSYVIGASGRVNNFVARGNSVIDTISIYKGVATAGIGVPAVYGASGYVSQSTAVPLTNIIGSTAVAGEYIIHYYADQSCSALWVPGQSSSPSVGTMARLPARRCQ